MPDEILNQGMQEEVGADSEINKRNLDDLFSKVEDEQRRMNSNKILSKNKVEEDRVQALREVLELFQQSGIDPNDPEQINAFMQKLAEMNPDLLVIFEDAMNYLLGEAEGQQGQEQVVSPEGAPQGVPQEQPPGQSMQSPAQMFPNLMK